MSDMTENELLAAEFALGLLSGPELAAAQARVLGDPGFADAADGWRARFDTIDADPVVPPPHLWRAIETRLGANDDAPAATRWKWATLAMSAVAAALLGVIVLRPPPVSIGTPAPVERTITKAPVLRQPPLVASLSGKRGTVVTIAYDDDARGVVVTPVVLGAGERDAELWVIPVATGKPVSLGVVDALRPTMRQVSTSTRSLLIEGATVAVSLEPRGGSTTGGPTGPVVATGKIVRV